MYSYQLYSILLRWMTMDFKERSTLGGAFILIETSSGFQEWFVVLLRQCCFVWSSRNWPHSSGNISVPDECGQSLTIRNSTVAIKRWITPEVLNCFQLVISFRYISDNHESCNHIPLLTIFFLHLVFCSQTLWQNICKKKTLKQN